MSSGITQSRPVYLDYAATTPVDPRVAAKMIPYLTELFGNPASRSHPYGWEAAGAVEAARAEVAKLIGAEASEIVFVSGATEGINLAIKGAAREQRERGRHIVTVATEHHAVLDAVQALVDDGFTSTVVTPGEDGLVTCDQIEAALQPDTIVVSVMLVNNEIGVVNPIAEIGAMLRARGIVFHCDAVQGAGKTPIDVKALQVDLLSITAHKMYGPKGVGALYVSRKPRVRVAAQIHGGGQEKGMRSGTLATHQIVGLGEAARIARVELEADRARIAALRDTLWAGLRRFPGVLLNGAPEPRVPHVLNVSFDAVDGDAFRMGLGGIAVSSASACASGDPSPSHVLRAIGRSDVLAANAIRFSIGRFTTHEEIERAIDIVGAALVEARPSVKAA